MSGKHVDTVIDLQVEERHDKCGPASWSRTYGTTRTMETVSVVKVSS